VDDRRQRRAWALRHTGRFLDAGLDDCHRRPQRDGQGDLVLYDPATGIWFRLVPVGPGVFTESSGTWLPDGALIGQPR
jgi:hypothetical protein